MYNKLRKGVIPATTVYGIYLIKRNKEIDLHIKYENLTQATYVSNVMSQELSNRYIIKKEKVEIITK